MLSFKLLNKSGQFIKCFNSVKAAYTYAEDNHIEEFTVQTIQE